MQYLIGIDDTDNLESRGTGFRARELAQHIAREPLTLISITRHQLFVDERIPYTAQNSSACILVDMPGEQLADLVTFCRYYLERESASGSDVGLCIAPFSAVDTTVQVFGQDAKEEVLTKAAALRLAESADLLLEELRGDGSGVIGALAAVGLRATGHDGRFIWLPGIRDIEGIYTAKTLYNDTGIEKILTTSGEAVLDSARINVGSWVRPILKDGAATLLVVEANTDGKYDWNIAPKEVYKRY
jgi:hypothetical protein